GPVQPRALSAVRVAAGLDEPLVLRSVSVAGAVLPRMRHDLEYVLDTWTMPRVRSSLALDVVSQLRRLVAARGLVRGYEVGGTDAVPARGAHDGSAFGCSLASIDTESSRCGTTIDTRHIRGTGRCM